MQTLHASKNGTWQLVWVSSCSTNNQQQYKLACIDIWLLDTCMVLSTCIYKQNIRMQQIPSLIQKVWESIILNVALASIPWVHKEMLQIIYVKVRIYICNELLYILTAKTILAIQLQHPRWSETQIQLKVSKMMWNLHTNFVQQNLRKPTQKVNR